MGWFGSLFARDLFRWLRRRGPGDGGTDGAATVDGDVLADADPQADASQNDTSTNEAAANDAGGSDATSDAGASDATSDAGARDAANDATSAPPAEAGNVSFCGAQSATPTFCADFDEGSATTAWINGVKQPSALTNAGAALSTSESVSAPGSLQAGCLSGFGADFEQIVFGAIPASQIHVELDVYLFSSGELPVFQLAFCGSSCGPQSAPAYELELRLSPAGNFACMSESNHLCNQSLTQSGSIPVGAWMHFTVDADMTSGVATLAAAGIPKVQGMLSATRTTGSGSLAFDVGIPECTDGLLMNVDNVTLNAH